MAAGSGPTELIVEGLDGGGLRHGVGHVEEGGDATCSGSTALALDVGLVGQAGLTEMHMAVNDARQDVAAVGGDTSGER